MLKKYNPMLSRLIFKKTGKSQEEKRKKNRDLENSKAMWKNKHLWEKIQDSLLKYDDNGNLKKEIT